MVDTESATLSHDHSSGGGGSGTGNSSSKDREQEERGDRTEEDQDSTRESGETWNGEEILTLKLINITEAEAEETERKYTENESLKENAEECGDKIEKHKLTNIPEKKSEITEVKHERLEETPMKTKKTTNMKMIETTIEKRKNQSLNFLLVLVYIKRKAPIIHLTNYHQGTHQVISQPPVKEKTDWEYFYK